MKKLRIVFMGTPEFAVPMLDALLQSQHEMVGVITAPDKPAGRGMQLHESEVKKFAVQHSLHILQPEKLKNETFLNELRALQADLFVVVAFRMLPQVVWSMPVLGTINLHASLLPDYRGAAPINWAIIKGERETGVTTFFIQQEIDTGKIIQQEKLLINDEETVGELYPRLMCLGAKVLRETVDAIATGNYAQVPQDHLRDVKLAPKIFKEDCRINFNQSAADVHNFVRGLSPYPAAWTTLHGKTLKIFSAKKLLETHSTAAGFLHSDGKTFLRFSCSDGWLCVNELQLEGKKRMSVEEFLRGYASLVITSS